MYYTQGNFFKIATGCLVHHYSPFDGHNDGTIRALGNKSGSFCEAVNCEQSEQEGKFLFATLWFPAPGIYGFSGWNHSSIGEQKRKLL